MQQRRLRPGDVLDDYCPRERRITDHAIVAMIEDDIKQTRCVSCDTEHEYKQAKVPPQRRKKAPPALFTQVLDGLQGPVRVAQNAESSDEQVGDDERDPDSPHLVDEAHEPMPPPATSTQTTPTPVTAQATDEIPSEPPAEPERTAEEGPVRRSLIRAQLPRHEGQQPPTRELPDFTIRQPTNGRGVNRPGGHGSRPGAPRRPRGPGQQQQGQGGATRFGGQGGRSNQFGRSSDRRHGSRPGQGQGQGPGHGQGSGQGHGHGQGRPNRGGRRGGGRKP
jgi:hypothetical protein